jgi:hypothetical protein
VRGTRRSASTKKKSDKGERSSRSSPKEKKPRSDSGYSSHAKTAGSSDASSPRLRKVESVKERESSKDKTHSRRKSSSAGSSTKSPTKSTKPPSAHRNVSFQPLEIPPTRSRRDDVNPGYYGISPVSAPAARPSMEMPNISRPMRPQSYYGGMPAPSPDNRPPLARSAFYIPPPGTSYPPAAPSPSWMNYAAPQHQNDYFSQPQPQGRPRPLTERFISQNADPIQRTASASGVKELTQAYFNATGYDGENMHPTPISIRRRSKEMEDIRAMPPPPRPDGIRRNSSIRRVPDSRDLPGTFPDYRDQLEDEDPYEQRVARTRRREELPRRRSSTSRGGYAYEPGMEPSRVRIETPTGRRRSYFGEAPPRPAYEDKVREAAGYQEEVDGGPSINLTAEALRRAQRPEGSNRSTRSSGSRDESDFQKRSATTRTSMSQRVVDGDDVTIRVKGNATINVAGAEINCDDGAEVNFVRRKSIRNGSERSGSDYGTIADDRLSRGSRPVNISRSSSKSGYTEAYANPWASRELPRRPRA